MVPYTRWRNVPYKIKEATEDGKPALETRYKTVAETNYKAVMNKAVLVADGKEVRVSRKDGQAVDPKDLPKLLSKETPVLVFAQGEIDPYYLQVIQEQVLIIVIPANKEFPGRTKADK
jgi:hypothetical protein